MKFICDVHISVRLSKFLAKYAEESVHINQILMGSSTSDSAICHHADQHNYIVITKDADFRNTYFLKKTPRKLIRICLGNLTNDSLVSIFENQLALIEKLNMEESFYLEIGPGSILIY